MGRSGRSGTNLIELPTIKGPTFRVHGSAGEIFVEIQHSTRHRSSGSWLDDPSSVGNNLNPGPSLLLDPFGHNIVFYQSWTVGVTSIPFYYTLHPILLPFLVLSLFFFLFSLCLRSSFLPSSP